MNTIRCPRCGSDVTKGEKFCKVCAKKIEFALFENAEKEQEQEEQNKFATRQEQMLLPDIKNMKVNKKNLKDAESNVEAANNALQVIYNQEFSDEVSKLQIRINDYKKKHKKYEIIIITLLSIFVAVVTVFTIFQIKRSKVSTKNDEIIFSPNSLINQE